MSDDKIVKGVSFNMKNKKDEELLKHALSYGNFAGYVKSLITEDKIRNPSRQDVRIEIPEVIEKSVAPERPVIQNPPAPPIIKKQEVSPAPITKRKFI